MSNEEEDTHLVGQLLPALFRFTEGRARVVFPFLRYCL